MKLHVSACNRHHQVSTMIKKSLYIFLIIAETDDGHYMLKHVVSLLEYNIFLNKLC